MDAHHRGIGTACGLVDATIYQLELAAEQEEIDESSFDSELWAHVSGLIRDGDWYKVASRTAIFVENHIRTWAGDPKDKNGESMIGKGLFAEVLGDASDWRLGSRSGEHEGWRMLGMGFAQALSNVDCHRIQDRADARRYAMGVLGLGSLLLTQLRHEHDDSLSRSPDGPR